MVLLHAWEIGRIAQAMNDEEGRYGTESVKRMAETLGDGIGKRILFEMMRFYGMYPDIEAVAALGLEWSSVRELMRLPADADRVRVAKTAQKGSFTVREVRTAVNDIKAKEEPKKPKTPKKPPRAVAWAEKLDSTILTALQNLHGVCETKVDMLKIAGDEDLTSEVDFIRLTQGRGNQKAILKRCKQSAERLTAFLAREVVPLEKVFDATPKAAQSGKAKKSKK